MDQSTRPAVFAAILLVALMLVTALPDTLNGGSGNDLPYRDGSHGGQGGDGVINHILLEEMAASGPGDILEIIVQFRREPTPRDLLEVERLGCTVVYRMTAIPAIFGRTTPGVIRELSELPNVIWIEHNYRLRYALHETVGVIDALRPWTTEMRDGDPVEFEFNTQSHLSGIDGSGVTVAVVDTGIDGQHPDFDYGIKLIYNKHKNGAEDPWIEMRNSDTSYGHGTHCAGIVAGNGDASGGRHRGVAPGAKLIGLGGDWVPFPSEFPVHWAVLQSLEWVYEHSRPGNNPHNIRVVSNSWGGAGDYDPTDAITVISNKLTYDNNVVVVFAAMNSGGDNHDGATDTTSRQSKIPSVISVAASTHDGTGMAPFSSRGQDGVYLTYPDVTAPGVDVWAARPRYTWLGEYQLEDEDYYYMEISGTSMATPHVAGLAAILFQAAPSLRVSDHRENYNGPDISWKNRQDTRIHEVEYILKMTADLIPFTGTNGVPPERDRGLNGRRMDYAQGYGLVNAHHAVALALTLEKMREEKPSATVDDALKVYRDIIGSTTVTGQTDTLQTSWRGEWGQLTRGSNPVSSTSFATDQSHRVFIPEAGLHLTVDLAYNVLDLDRLTGGNIDVTVDMDGDGVSDINRILIDLDGNKQYHIPLTSGKAAENRGKFWTFNVEGQGIKIPTPNPEDEFHEALIEYTIGVTLLTEPRARITLDERDFTTAMSPWKFGEPSKGYTTATISVVRYRYDVTDVEYQKPFLERYGPAMAALIILLAIGMVFGYGIMTRRTGSPDPEGAGTGDAGEGSGYGNDTGYTYNGMDGMDKMDGMDRMDPPAGSDGIGTDPDGDVTWEYSDRSAGDHTSDRTGGGTGDALKRGERTGVPDEPEQSDGSDNAIEWEDPL